MSTAVRKEDYYVSPEDYLAGERISETRHEYLAGVVYAMAGASRAHNRIAGNIFSALKNQLRGKKCEPFASDMKLRIKSDAATFYYYPDVMVDCSGEQDAVEEPVVIFEVLSPDTERIDRGEKMRNYQNLPSLAAYVLVDQFRPAVTVYRHDGGSWTMDFFADKSDAVELPSIECRLTLEAIYERLGF